jgi:hypothetical protein
MLISSDEIDQLKWITSPGAKKYQQSKKTTPITAGSGS